MRATLTYLENEGSGPCAIRIIPPSEDASGRTPSHFIALIDVSESMSDENKLVNVKQCMRTLLRFLTPEDELSIITFGDTGKIVLKRGKMGAAASASAAAASIESLHTDGCTNFSAGLAYVREILDNVQASGSRLKQGLLILTDGHANGGITDPALLRKVGSNLLERFPSLSISYIAYGTDHNAELLKGMAEDARGSYSIVNDIESAAMTMGDALGSILSCVAQNVSLKTPPGTTVIGNSETYTINADGEIRLGDLFAGNEQLLLLNAANDGEWVLKGALLPSLDPFHITITEKGLDTGRNVEIELTRLRYKCAELFRRMRELATHRRGAHRSEDALKRELAEFEDKLRDELFVGHPVLEMLQMELASLKNAMENIQQPEIVSQLIQHEVYTALGRGTSQPIHVFGGGVAAALATPLSTLDVSAWNSDDEGEPGDPENLRQTMRRTQGERVLVGRAASYMSPMSSRQQRQVAAAMRNGVVGTGSTPTNI